MQGVVLAGGLGTRFHPITKVLNKHLLDVFDEPMIFYPIRTLAKAGIQDVVLVTGEEIEQFKDLLGTGTDLGVNLSYRQQEGELGIAHALAQAEDAVTSEKVVVILGDNIYQEDLSPYVESFEAQERGARLLLKEVSPDDAQRFGVAVIRDSRIEQIVEKPHETISNLVVTGCYMFDARVFDMIRRLELSDRGEYEVTDLNNFYIEAGEMEFDTLRGWWTDAGTPASKLKASILVALNQGVTFHA